MSMKYVLCSHCRRPNPLKNSVRKEQTCIFCGRPFMVSEKKETRLVSDPIKPRLNRVPKRQEDNELEDVNLSKPMDKDAQSSLR